MKIKFRLATATACMALTFGLAAGPVTAADTSRLYQEDSYVLAAERVYIGVELLDGFPAFYNRAVEIGGEFNNEILIPLRAAAEMSGLEVTWEEETATAAVNGITVENRIEGYTGSSPVIICDYYYVSPSFFPELFGLELDLSFEEINEIDMYNLSFE